MGKRAKRATILIADDCIIHTQSLEQALGGLGLDFRIHIVRDGKRAIEYLSREPATDIFDEFPRPDLLLLDLDMPQVDGFEVLNWVRTRSRCRKLPIVVLSASNHLEAARKAYATGANGYMVKPFSDRDYLSLAEGLKKLLHDLEQSSATVLRK
jgi:CheY-like chemotaxis protein